MLIHSPKDLAIYIKNQRKKLKLSQADVGRLVGLKQQTVSEFELKPETTQLNTVFRILSAVQSQVKAIEKNAEGQDKTWTEEW